MSALVGLGEGVTPAGDDYLVGYFAGLWTCAGRDAARVAFLATLRERLMRSALPTGASAASISKRVRWRGVGTAFRCCRRIATGSLDAALRRAAARALAVGHSSGACGLLGFLDACACWPAPPRRQAERR